MQLLYVTYPEFEGVNTDESSVYYETAGDLNCFMHVCMHACLMMMMQYAKHKE